MKRHPVDSVSLVFALLFSAAVGWWGVAMISRDPLHVPAAWIGAGTLLIIGLVGLMSALRPQRRPTAAPITVPQAPQPALDVDPYNDPFLASVSLPRVDGVLDAEAIAAAYREAGFDDPVPVSGPNAAPISGGPGAGAPATEVPTFDTPNPGAHVPTFDGPNPGAHVPTFDAPSGDDTAVDADAPTAGLPAANPPAAGEPRAEADGGADTVPLAGKPVRDGDTTPLPAERDGGAAQ